MNDLEKFIKKELEKKYFNIYLILTKLMQTENIISFTYDNDYLMIRTGVNDYYRFNLKEVN